MYFIDIISPCEWKIFQGTNFSEKYEKDRVRYTVF